MALRCPIRYIAAGVLFSLIGRACSRIANNHEEFDYLYLRNVAKIKQKVIIFQVKVE